MGLPSNKLKGDLWFGFINAAGGVEVGFYKDDEQVNGLKDNPMCDFWAGLFDIERSAHSQQDAIKKVQVIFRAQTSNHEKVVYREVLRKRANKPEATRSRWRRQVRRNRALPVIVDEQTDLSVRKDLARK